MIHAPCKDCPDKGCGRHSTCEKYLQYKRYFHEIKKQLYKSSDAGEFLAENAYRTMRRRNR